MCTVTFVPDGNRVILTSNRDEHTGRPMPRKPEWYTIGGKQIFFPKDPFAGGTWFAVGETANIAVLLNGALVPHNRDESYERSRGLVLLDLIAADDPALAWKDISLQNIEPFTMVLFASGKLRMWRWDSSVKTEELPGSTVHHIWASVTLYSPEAIEARKAWFKEFMAEHPHPQPADLLEFHSNAGSHDPRNGLVMERDGVVKTQSITQAVLSKDEATLFHRDMNTKVDFSETFKVGKIIRRH